MAARLDGYFSFRLVAQQRQQERERKQCRHALPESHWLTFIERPRSAHCNRRARRSRFHLHTKFGDVAKTLGRVEGDRSPEHSLEPGREVWAKGGERLWSFAARRAGGVGIPVRELAGESAENGDAQSVEVGGFVSRFARKHFGR